LGKGPEEYGNMGDISMLQAAVARLQKLFPRACLEVLTDSPENLARFCPAARPLDNLGRTLWLANGVLMGKVSRIAPQGFVDLLVWLKKTTRLRCPKLFRAMLIWRLKYAGRTADVDAVKVFTEALWGADLLLIAGAGGFFDGCQTWNLDMLDLLEAAVQRGMPVAMLGQGFGPLSDPLVLAQAARVLPRVNFITLRGNRGAHALIRSLGVSELKFQTTGDEAIELAYESRSEKRGSALGVNLRFGASASTDDDDIERIRPVLQDFARRHNISLIPIPIAIQIYTRDDLAIKQLLVDFDEQSDGGQSLDSPMKVIKQVGLCRVVVTGAYHAAVFALAQGIPVVGLAKSAYFSSKFQGLEDQFGEGCQTVFLNEPAFPQMLHAALEKAWKNADELRGPLEAATIRQIELSRKSYERLEDLVPCTKRNVSRAQACVAPAVSAND
jgi:colanic acid/amylovoran biosynthesis protein